MDNLRIKIFCRSFNLRLYRLSKGLYENWGYPCVRLTDQSADGYFHTMLQDTECDIAINVDEDCFITSKQNLMSLVDFVVANNIANAGCPDGGAYVPRGTNPLVTNPFFNVFNLNLIRAHYSKDAVKQFDYMAHKKELEASYPKQMLYEGRKYRFNVTDAEPYYPFFLWQAYTTKTFYLPSKPHPDGWTTILCNQEGKEMCRHTWLARFYSVPTIVVKTMQPSAGKQKQRIDAVIKEAYEKAGEALPIFTWRDNCSFIFNSIVRWIIKVPQRIMGWPAKIRKKIKR